MTLQEYINQHPVMRTTHYSVILKPEEYTVFFIDKKTAGIHIHKYPEFTYVVREKSGYVCAVKEQRNGIIYKSTVFRININDIKNNQFELL